MRLNPYQKVKFYHASHRITGRLSIRIENFTDYLSLYNENRELAEENSRLYNLLRSSFSLQEAEKTFAGDTSLTGQYQYLTARVINNTVNKQFNYITLDRGSKVGIYPDMAVICNKGIVGIVKSVSPNYAAVLSVLNRDFIASGKIKKSGYFGPISWNGKNSSYVTLVDIPHHVEISPGDTVVTSGFGGVFPEGFMIGLVDDARLKGGNYYEIRVKLSTDFRKLNHVQIIYNYARQEIDSLQNAASR
jgi:rod shape-determining protein MreC